VARRCQYVSDSGDHCKRTEDLCPKFIEFLYINIFFILIPILCKQTSVSKDANNIDVCISQCNLQILINRRHSWKGHIIKHNEFVVIILEGAISGKMP
jgi:hypothetical protein